MIDCAIIGGGPAGLTAGMYASRSGLKEVVVFEKIYPGGQITSSSEIENYPGFNDVKSGIDFMDTWVPQATKFGCQVKSAQGISKISKQGDIFYIEMDDGSTEKAKTVVVATGTKPKKAGFEGEDEFFGRGVGVCAVCDGFFYRNKDVAVIGGGDSAVEESYFLSQFCKSVTVFARGDELKAAPNTVQRVYNTPNIKVITHSKILKAIGDSSGVTAVEFEQNGHQHILNVSGVFVFVGRTINNEMLSNGRNGFICNMDYSGRVIVDLKMRTNIEGLFAAGDIRAQSVAQVICAAGDGAVAATSAIEYIHNKGI